MVSSEKILTDSREIYYEIRTNFVRILYEWHDASIFTPIHSREIRTKFVRNSHEFRTNFTRFSRNWVTWGRGMVETCDKCLPQSTGFVPNTMPRPKEPFHLLADRTQRRRLQTLQQVVTKELAAPYGIKFVPDTGQIVLTP